MVVPFADVRHASDQADANLEVSEIVMGGYTLPCFRATKAIAKGSELQVLEPPQNKLRK